MDDFISYTFVRGDKKWAFQRVGRWWNLYQEDGSFVKEFRSFKSMCDYMTMEDKNNGTQY